MRFVCTISSTLAFSWNLRKPHELAGHGNADNMEGEASLPKGVKTKTHLPHACLLSVLPVY